MYLFKFQVTDIPPFLLENTYEQQLAQYNANSGGGDPPVPPRRLRNDSYLGAISKDNIMVRAGLQVLFVPLIK